LVAAFSLVLGVGSAAAAAPTISSTSVSAVTSKAALLEAAINPEGEATTYHFEYGTADCSSNPCTSAPIPNGNVGSGGSAVKVTREVEGLSPGTTYHFRVVANNGSGPSAGPDHAFTTYATSAPNANCPNQTFRVGFSASLADCRAYEMVSPVDKNGGDVRSLAATTGPAGFRSEINQAAVDGGKFTFSSYKAFAGAVGSAYSNQYIAKRGVDGWSTEAISPPRALRTVGSTSKDDGDVAFKAFTDSLSQTWFTNRSRFPLTPDAIAGQFTNVYSRDNTDGSLRALTADIALPPNPEVSAIEFGGHSPQGEHVVFISTDALTPDAINNGEFKLYDYSSSGLRLVSVLPNGEPAPGMASAGQSSTANGSGSHGLLQVDRAVSDDGSRIFWSEGPGSEGRAELYVRIDGTTTIPVSEGVGFFWAASGDGSKALYGKVLALKTNFEELYEFDVDTETRTLIASEVRGVAGTSKDLSHIYFISNEALAPGATAGERNLYLDHEGTMVFIATLAAEDTAEAGGTEEMPNVGGHLPIQRPTRVSDDGRYLAFMSSQSLTGYDNTDAITGEADFEVYRYDAQTSQLICVSCNPSGARPVGRAIAKPYRVNNKDTDFGIFQSGNPVEFWTAAWLPTWENSWHASRALTEDGSRIFFNSFDALVAQDTNGKQDVYEWEAQGAGTCQKASGCIELISSGQSSEYSEFLDASPTGHDVFFRTLSGLDPRDPGLWDVYDARVDGGYPPPPPPPPPCAGDACQGTSSAPTEESLASAAFQGSGDPSPRRTCGDSARRVAKLNRLAEQLSRAARRSSSPGRSRSLQLRSARAAAQAKRLERSVARCRHANRGSK